MDRLKFYFKQLFLDVNTYNTFIRTIYAIIIIIIISAISIVATSCRQPSSSESRKLPPKLL